MGTRLTTAAGIAGIMAVMIGMASLGAQEELEAPVPAEPFLSPTQTFDILFSLHPSEIDRLSNVRVLGTVQLPRKTFLRFQTLLGNQRQEGLIDLEDVAAILPNSRPLVATPELLLDRQPLEDEVKVKEIREETVREVIRERAP